MKEILEAIYTSGVTYHTNVVGEGKVIRTSSTFFDMWQFIGPSTWCLMCYPDEGFLRFDSFRVGTDYSLDEVLVALDEVIINTLVVYL